MVKYGGTGVMVTVAALALLAALGAWFALRDFSHEVAALAEQVSTSIREARVMTMVSTWKDADGIEHVVNTPREDGQSADDQAAAHKEGVDALKALFPPA